MDLTLSDTYPATQQVVHGMCESAHVRRIHRREHAHAQLVAAELAVRLGVHDAVGPQDLGDRGGIDVVGEVDGADEEPEDTASEPVARQRGTYLAVGLAGVVAVVAGVVVAVVRRPG